MKFKEFSNALDVFYDLQIDREDIKTLWSLDHYDGPMSGLVGVEDEIYLAECPLDPYLHPRVYLLIETPDEKINELIAWLEIRYKIAGNMKYHPDGTRDSLDIPHMTKEFQKKMDKFNKEHPMPKYYPKEDDEIVGWFQYWRK